MKNNIDYSNVDEYVNMFNGDVKKKLQQIRQEIKNTVPEAEETISYRMPAFKLRRILVYFAAHKNHIGFYPTPDALIEFKDVLTNYKTSKAAIQFPLDKPLPLQLIKDIVKFRAESDKSHLVK